MSELAISGVVGFASLVCVALGWRTPNGRRLLIVLGALVNLTMASAHTEQARLLSWSVCGALIAIGLLTSRRENWRNPSVLLSGLALIFVAASYFSTDAPATVQRGLLILLGVTTALAILSSLTFVARLMRTDTTRRA